MTEYFTPGYQKDFVEGMIVATHPAPVGTFIVYAEADGKHHKTPVVLWGVQTDGSPVPITLSGAWDNVTNANMFVLHPDGSCSTFENAWDSIDEAIETMKLHA